MAQQSMAWRSMAQHSKVAFRFFRGGFFICGSSIDMNSNLDCLLPLVFADGHTKSNAPDLF